MPDGALEATERQFLSLLDAASGDTRVCVSLYSMPTVPRGALGEHRIRNFYSSVEELLHRQVDGLIVTGREPLATDLADEPYWDSFVQTLEWARENTFSTIWSCLAAHAAVLHMDGVQRERSNEKHCGILDCARISDHPITTDLPPQFRLPHSRWNGVPETELTNRGYQVLTRAGVAGVDSFVKQGSSLFLFFQGHLEYEPNTLLLEYRRDVDRFLRGQSTKYPLIPTGYFNSESAKELSEIQAGRSTRSNEETLARLDAVLSAAAPTNGWHTAAATIYRNWLNYIASQKTDRVRGRDFAVQRPLAAASSMSRPVRQQPVSATE
jgi:homoserine O-succinyltransferase